MILQKFCTPSTQLHNVVRKKKERKTQQWTLENLAKLLQTNSGQSSCIALEVLHSVFHKIKYKMINYRISESGIFYKLKCYWGAPAINLDTKHQHHASSLCKDILEHTSRTRIIKNKQGHCQSKLIYRTIPFKSTDNNLRLSTIQRNFDTGQSRRSGLVIVHK